VTTDDLMQSVLGNKLPHEVGTCLNNVYSPLTANDLH